MRRVAAWALLSLALLACNGDDGNLPAPFNLVVAQQGNAAALSWECDGDPDSYLIQRSDDIDNSFRNWATIDAGRKYYSDYTVQSKRQYYYRVAAGYNNEKNETEYSEYSRSVGIYIQ